MPKDFSIGLPDRVSGNGAFAMILSIMLATLATFSNALGAVLQRHAVLTVPTSASLRIGILTDQLRNPIWLAGLLGVVLSAPITSRCPLLHRTQRKKQASSGDRVGAQAHSRRRNIRNTRPRRTAGPGQPVTRGLHCRGGRSSL